MRYMKDFSQNMPIWMNALSLKQACMCLHKSMVQARMVWMSGADSSVS